MPFQLPSLLYDIPRSLPWAIGLPILLGSLNGKITQKNVKTWYPTLKQPPPGPPPRWVFPVVWTSLYAGMGWAAHLAVRALDTSPHAVVRRAASNALALWYAQFALNMAWTPLFFGAKKTGLASIDIVGLWGTVAACMIEMAKVDHRTVYVFVPYLCWLFYASYLNIGVWYLNGGNKKIDKYTQDGKQKKQQ
ncbi:TspO/MBR-related protein [Cystobasidium minutum MCA 4210]|uniref:TspO/MBR-related protein n=1 Tax=Cystobasidium minutum MCA 4210 TaxID=1397322 RepID=UPI0034CD2145|eukprot:jgi/Rhomi1/171812/fgenesh1_kg.4_\